MAEIRKGLLEPFSMDHPSFGRIKKVFIAYAHNPDHYEKYIPPYQPAALQANPALYQLVLREKAEHEWRQQDKIQRQKDAVRRLAEVLGAGGVPVAYDQYNWEGPPITNQLHHYEQQMRDSDFVLLVITPSLLYYMNNEVPLEDEILLAKDFLSNLMTVKKPHGTHFLPVFINCEKDLSLVPTALGSTRCYQLVEPFNVEQGDLYTLYAMLTNQQTVDLTPPAQPIVVPKRSGPFGHLVRKQEVTQEDQQLYQYLRTVSQLLSPSQLMSLTTHLHGQWERIATALRLSERDILDCKSRAGVTSNSREAAYQMLCHWRDREPSGATIGRLSDGLYTAKCFSLLRHLRPLVNQYQ